MRTKIMPDDEVQNVLTPQNLTLNTAVKARELAVQIVLAETAFGLNDYMTAAVATRKARAGLSLLGALAQLRGTQDWFDRVVAPWASRLHDVEDSLDQAA